MQYGFPARLKLGIFTEYEISLKQRAHAFGEALRDHAVGRKRGSNALNITD